MFVPLGSLARGTASAGARPYTVVLASGPARPDGTLLP